MALNNQELVIAGVVVALFALVAFNNKEEEDPGEARFKLEENLNKTQNKIRQEMMVWSDNVERFLKDLPSQPRAPDQDTDWDHTCELG